MIRSTATESSVSITRKTSIATCLFCSKVMGLSICCSSFGMTMTPERTRQTLRSWRAEGC
jgi:hypothetical protein